MILPLFYYNHPMLRKKAQSVDLVSEEIVAFANDLVESMIHYNGVGLAAPQVGKLLRIIVILWLQHHTLGTAEVILCVKPRNRMISSQQTPLFTK